MSAQQNEERLDLLLDSWRLVTDGMMGGVSEGRSTLTELFPTPLLSTGFI